MLGPRSTEDQRALQGVIPVLDAAPVDSESWNVEDVFQDTGRKYIMSYASYFMQETR